MIGRQRTIREEALVQIDTLEKQAGEMGIVISSLSGTERDQDTIVLLTAAFLSLMGFVETIQRIADREALKTLISQAATVYRDGADLGGGPVLLLGDPGHGQSEQTQGGFGESAPVRRPTFRRCTKGPA